MKKKTKVFFSDFVYLQSYENTLFSLVRQLERFEYSDSLSHDKLAFVSYDLFRMIT